MTTGEQIQAELEDAEQALAKHHTLTARLARAEEALVAADRAVKEARARLDDENDQVRKLESFSTTRIWAVLNGSRDEQLSVEKAGQEAAEYAVAAAEAERESRATERNDVLARRRALGEPAQRRERALAAKEQWLTASGSGLGTELAELGRRTGALREERPGPGWSSYSVSSTAGSRSSRRSSSASRSTANACSPCDAHDAAGRVLGITT
jgi:hypothetical protein